MNNKYKELYAYLSDNNMTDLDENSFYNEYSQNDEKFSKLYSNLKGNKMTDLDPETFKLEYFGTPIIKKKSQVESTESSLEVGSSERLSTTTTRQLESSIYILPSNPGALYRKKGDSWLKKIGENYIPLSKGDVRTRENILDKQAVLASQFDLDRIEYSPKEVEIEYGSVSDAQIEEKFPGSTKERWKGATVGSSVNKSTIFRDRDEEEASDLKMPEPKIEPATFEGKLYMLQEGKDNENFYKNPVTEETYLYWLDNNGKPKERLDPIKSQEAVDMAANIIGDSQMKQLSKINKIDKIDLNKRDVDKFLKKELYGSNFGFNQEGNELTINSYFPGMNGDDEGLENSITIDLSKSNSSSIAKEFLRYNLFTKREKESLENIKDTESYIDAMINSNGKIKMTSDRVDVISEWARTESMAVENDIKRNEVGVIDKDIKSYEEKTKLFKKRVASGNMTQQEFDKENDDLSKLYKDIIIKQKRAQEISNRAQKLISAEELIQTKDATEEKGSSLGAGLRSWVNSFNVTPLKIGLDISLAGGNLMMGDEKFAKLIDGNYGAKKAKGLTDAQIANYSQAKVKELNDGLMELSLERLTGTNKEYMQSSKRGMIFQALNAVIESVGTAASGSTLGVLSKAGSAAAKRYGAAAFFSMSYNAMEDQMRGPDFDHLTENEKKLISVPYGLVIGQMEKWGFEVAAGAGKNPLFNKFANYIVTKTFKNLPKNAGLIELNSAIQKNVGASIAKGLIKITGAGVSEGNVEFMQQEFEGIQKFAVNEILKNDNFNEEYFKDAEDLTKAGGWSALLGQGWDAFKLGALAGGMTSAGASVKDNITDISSNNKFDIYKSFVLNTESRNGWIASIKEDEKNGKISSEEMNKKIDQINKSYSTLTKIPASLTTQSQREAFSLLQEKEIIENEIKDKEPNLVVKETNRIKEINEALKTTSENATKEDNIKQQEGTAEGGISEYQGTGEGQQKDGGNSVGGEVKFEKGNKIQWNVFGNEESGEWTVGEKTKTRGGKDAVVLTKVYVEASSDGKSYTKEYADANGIKYDNERTVEHIVPLEDLQSLKEQSKAEAKYDAELNQIKQTQKSDQVATYRAEEQAELLKAIPKIESYKVNGEIDKTLMPKTVLAKYNKIYDNYDKLISPLLETTGEVAIDKPVITTNTTAEVQRVKSLTPESEDGATFNIDGTKYEGVGLVVPVDSMNTTTEELTPEMVADFVAERQKMIGDAGVVKAGIYKFPNSNQVSIDLSVVVPETSREQALEFARLAGQESLFDLETFENIKTGATGENPMKFTPEQHREISKALKEGRMPNVFGTTAETTNNLLTKENVKEVEIKQTTPKNKLIVKAAKMVLNAIPGVKIYIHNNGQEMASAIEASKKQLTKEEKTGLTESSGLYVDGDIHINLESATIGTVYHEAFHALIEKNGMKSGSILLMAKGLKNIISDKGVKQRLDDFVSQYNEDEKAEEYISELGGILSEAEQELTTTKLQQFKTLINNIAKKLGLPVIFSASANAQDAADFINTMSKKLRTGENILADGFQTNIISDKIKSQIPVKVNKNQKLTFVKQSDIIDIKSLVDDIVSKNETVWFWVADQLGRGVYFDSVINGNHYLDAGPSYALDPENRSKNIIWASGANPKTLNNNIDRSDYIFIISGSPQSSKLFNKKVSGIVRSRIEDKVDFNEFKKSILNSKPTKQILNIIKKYNSYDELFNGSDRKAVLISINEQKSKNTKLNKVLESYDAFIDLNELRDGFYKENDFKLGDVMLVLKPEKIGDKSNHSTYETDIIGSVVGVPDLVINSFDLMTDEVKNKYKNNLERIQQQQIVAPYGMGVKNISKIKFQKNKTDKLTAPVAGNKLFNDEMKFADQKIGLLPSFAVEEGSPSKIKAQKPLKEEIIAYHRSSKKFNKFNISNISTDSNKQKYGYGLYFSDNIPIEEYGDYLYKVKLFKGKKEYDLIDTKKAVEEKIVNKVVKALNDNNKKSDEVVEFSYNGWLFYKTLSRILGGDKQASNFLSNNGIDGLKNNISNNWNDYVLFNDNVINIENNEEDAPSKIKKQLTTDKYAKPGAKSALDALGETNDQREVWRKNNKVNQKQKRNPIVEQAVKDYYNEKINQEQYLDIVAKNQPIKPFKTVPALPSLEDITNSLDISKVATGIIGLTKNLENGEKVASRLDIPAYEDYDTWVVSLHDGNKEGKSIAYGQTAVLKNVDFKTFPGSAIRIAMGTQNKSTIGRMFGDWVNEDPELVHARAKELINDPAWTQVGMNPFRYSWFYDKSDGMPVASADEVIQVGALVLAKNAKKVLPSDPIFETKSAKGGKIKFQKKAPNGKPSNLNDVQWGQVRTPAFKKWFGDWENDPQNASKVVDENGEPRVVYHGSNAEFDEFKNRLFGYRGFYFTDKISVARDYGSNVRPFFLNSKDFVLEDMEGDSYSNNQWIDNLIETSEMDNKDVHLLNFIDPLDPSSKSKVPISNIYVIFNKSNIKLADGTNTTFDATQPNIKFQKKAPSVDKILGTPKPSMVTVKEKTALKDQIKLEARAAREAKGDLNQKRKLLSTAIKGLVKLGKLTTRQAAIIINRVSVVNLDNQVMVNRLADYAARVFEKADYQERLSRAFSFRKGIRKLLKGDIQAEVVGMAKKFSKIDPSMVDDIEKYLEMAEIVKNAIKPSRVNRKDLDVNMRESMNIDSVSEFTNDAIENQEAILKEELLAVHSELVDAGVIDDKMSLKDIESIINSLKEEADDADYESDILTFLSRRIDTMSAIIKDILIFKINPMTGEDVALTEKNIDLISRMLNIDINNVSIKEAIFIAEAMDNFINNNITSSVEAVIEKQEGATELENLIADKVVASPLRKYFSTYAGQFFSEQVASMPILFEKLFVGAKKGLMVAKKMGWTALINGVNKAEKMFNTTVDVYFKQYKNTKPNGKSFNDAENVYERGMLAFLSRNVSGTVTQQAEELKRRVEVLKESVKSLLEGSSKEQKMGELYQKIYDKLNVESGDIDVIHANADKINRSAVGWWINQWGTTYSDLSDISLSVYNTMLSSDASYSTDRYKLLDKANLEEIIEPKNIGAFGRDIEFLDKNKTGVLMESNRPSASKVSKANRYISLDFDINNSSAYKAALIDVNTAAAIRRIDGFINSKNFNKLIPTKEDRDIFRKRISEYIQAAKNKRVEPSDTMRLLDQLTNFLGGVGVAKALGGIDQVVKQTLPIALSTFVNSGRFDLVMPGSSASVWIDSLGMAISNRGQESQSTIESVDRRLEKASGLIDKSTKAFVDVQQFWLKYFLSKPDVFIAKSSFISYYKQYLSNNNQSTDIDWTTHNVNQDAADYAMIMVDRQQNVSDTKMAGKIFSSQDSTKKIMRKIFLPFASFSLNQKSRMVSDIKVLGMNSGASKQDKAIAARSLASLPFEMALYQSMSLAIRLGYLAIAKGIIGAVADDDDEEKEKLLGMEISKELKNATKYPLRSMITDFLSPAPVLDNLVVGGANALLRQSEDKEMIDDAVDKKNLMLEVLGKDKMNEDQKEKFIKKFKKDHEYQLFNDEQKSYGTIGIGIDLSKEIMDNAKTAYTGQYTDDYMGKESERFLLPKDQDNIKNAVIFETLFALGLLPRDVNTVTKNIIKLSKKNSLTEKQYEKYEAVGKETGAKVTGWKMDLTRSKSKLETTVSEIEWIEKHGGLNEKQGKEYVKLSSVVDEVSYRELQKIQSGKTADQIINSYSKK